MSTAIPDNLPICEVFDALRSAFGQRNEVVLQAPPGAGKTTAVPLLLLNESWLSGQSILLVQPRRMAARTTALRMAELLDEAVGVTVGYRIRLDTCVSAATRIEVVTEGVLARRLQNDPELDGVGLVIFDEFHERNLDSDLGLALVLQARALFRDSSSPLRLLVMSATLDGTAVANMLDDAPIITSAGRQYPVAIEYHGVYRPREAIAPRAAQVIVQALREQDGSVLAFLPGQAEIHRTASLLAGRLDEFADPVQICPLYGGLSLQRQQQAIAAAPEGERKVVLATNIAETSLTIEGVRAVVDSGLVREAEFDPATGITRLATRRISRASADQRAGRAGRLAPGTCYRLWSEEQQRQLVAHSTPEILQADMAPVALQLLAWGVHDPAELTWLDLPPEGPYQQALEVLRECRAVSREPSGDWQLTPHGVRLAQMPLHPRLAHMLITAQRCATTEEACLLAALLSERSPDIGRGSDLTPVLQLLEMRASPGAELRQWWQRTRDQAQRYRRILDEQQAAESSPLLAGRVAEDEVPGLLMACAYPDRIARRIEGPEPGLYQLSNGRRARLASGDPLCGESWLAVADLGGHKNDSEDRIYAAVPLAPALFDSWLIDQVDDGQDSVYWDGAAGRLVAERQRRVGRLVLGTTRLETVPPEARNAALLTMLQREGLSVLPWNDDLLQWRARVMLLREHALQRGKGNPWPDLSDDALLASLEAWLLPWLDSVQRREDFARLDLRAILHALLPWPLPMELARLAPENITVPSGSRHRIDYTVNPPVLAVKLQEMFGLREGPRICDGAVPLTLHLLSPARRPLQVTSDLASFWSQGYPEVRKEMRGRYPKHPWPEDPLSASPTRHTRARQEAGQGG